VHSCLLTHPPPFGWKTILPLAPSDDSLATNWSCVTKPHSVRVSYGSDFDVDDVCGVDDGAPTFWNGSWGLAHLPWRSLMAYRERLHQVTKSLPVVTGQLFSCFVFLSEKISNSNLRLATCMPICRTLSGVKQQAGKVRDCPANKVHGGWLTVTCLLVRQECHTALISSPILLGVRWPGTALVHRNSQSKNSFNKAVPGHRTPRSLAT